MKTQFLKSRFGGSTWKYGWGGAASKQAAAPQWYSQSEAGNKAKGVVVVGWALQCPLYDYFG